jgi:proteasome lid subunit RPN8/RPN11
MPEKRRLRLRFLENESPEPGRFKISKRSVEDCIAQLEARGFPVVGSFHSHVVSHAIPGEGDIRRAFLRGMELIYDVCGETARLWKVTNRKKLLVKELGLRIGRPRKK